MVNAPPPGQRFVLLVTIMIVVILGVGCVLAVRNYGNDRRAAEELALVSAREAASRVDDTVSARIGFVTAVAALQPVVAGDSAGIHAVLSRLVTGGAASDMGWIRRDGTVGALAGPPPSRTPTATLRDREYFRAVMDTGEPFVTDPMVNAADPATSFVIIAVPTSDTSGARSGVLTAMLRLRDLVGPLRLTETGPALRLVDRSGRVVSAGGPEPPPPADPAALDRVRRAPFVATDVPGTLGEPGQLVAAARVPATGWIAVRQQPADEALADARWELGMRITAWVLVALAGIGVAWILGRRLDRSVRGERLARARIDLLRRTGGALAAAVTVQEVTAAAISDPELEAVAVAIYRRMDAAPAAVAGALDPERYERLRAQAPLPGGPVAHTMRTGEPRFLEEAPEDAAVTAAGLGAGPRRPAVASLPLRTWSEPTGVMLVAFPEPRPFSPDQRALLLTLADQTAQALDRAIQHEAERARRRRAELLERLTTALEREMTVRGRAQLATELVVPEVGDFATIERRDDQGWCVLGLHHRDPALEPVLRTLRREHRLDPAEEHSVAQTAVTGRPRLVAPITPEMRAAMAPDAQAAALLTRLEPTSTVMLPLHARGHLTGALVLGRAGAERDPLGPDDVTFGEEIASRLGVALENAQLYEQQREIAVGLQLSLLPEAVPELPGNRLAVRYRPGQHHMEVGGDWYDAFELPDGRLALAVGDVVGRGLSAAAAMGRLRTALAALGPEADRPAVLLRRLDTFAASVPGSELTTLVYAMFTPSTGHLVYASAGHPPGLVVYPDGVTHWLMGGRSVPLRSVPGPVRNEAGAELPPGAKLLLYSDGLVERRREGIDAGLDRLAAAARRHHALEPEAFVDAVIGDLDDPEGMGDDLVVVCLQHVGVAAGTPMAAVAAGTFNGG